MRSRGEFEGKTAESDVDSFREQHLRQVAIDHENGIFTGTNGFVEKLVGRSPKFLEAYISKHRDAFARARSLVGYSMKTRINLHKAGRLAAEPVAGGVGQLENHRRDA